MAEHEEEEEEATESISNQALAYHAPEHEPSPAYILGVVLLAAFAGASTMRKRPRRGGRGAGCVQRSGVGRHVSCGRFTRARAPWRATPGTGRVDDHVPL